MDYILNTKAGMRLDFPPNKFGYNSIEADLVKEKTPDIDANILKGMIKPYPHLKFNRGQAVVTDEETIENPWTIDMVRNHQAYKDGDIWELSQEQVDELRKADPYPSLILPHDFNKLRHEYQKGIDFLKQPFKPSKEDEKRKEECDEYLLTLQRVREIYRIVNLTIPKEQTDLNRYARLLEACRVQVEILFEEQGL